LGTEIVKRTATGISGEGLRRDDDQPPDTKSIKHLRVDKWRERDRIMTGRKGKLGKEGVGGKRRERKNSFVLGGMTRKKQKPFFIGKTK